MTFTNMTSPMMTPNAILAEEPPSKMPAAHSNPAKPNHERSGDDRRWNAVEARDPARDGEFVFAVATTGVYCRPSCPARRPPRENVTFYSHTQQAATAAFAACLRSPPPPRR